ncbi:PAAR domain-containing protein [Chryseobacterium caseinilyticum]|uniref:PAAR domain-containing protein n=1 Tax=Chryseobacterium caseinilyticum TaxID=2771428 RepID=A0ABR8ZAP7_9FLAO|nr:PAAR domain-containing protein [Chryseobacterium caseinilyticum]MBD8082302.1 PAAR domain-containing protein [Chryseobacterium caseinilyticum]
MGLAARATDMHTCPMVSGTVPHVGGPILPGGNLTVMIGGIPAAVVGDSCICTGPPDSLIKGSATVMIGGKSAVRVGDSTAHGGVVILGCPTVNIGG